MHDTTTIVYDINSVGVTSYGKSDVWRQCYVTAVGPRAVHIILMSIFVNCQIKMVLRCIRSPVSVTVAVYNVVTERSIARWIRIRFRHWKHFSTASPTISIIKVLDIFLFCTTCSNCEHSC